MSAGEVSFEESKMQEQFSHTVDEDGLRMSE
jgi:hypothetical protein